MSESNLLDLRSIPPSQRHPLIFSTFDALDTGAAFEIVNDHDPVPLYMQFERSRLGQFDWRYVVAGPDQWQIRISRKATAGTPRSGSEGGECCGVCTCRGGR